MRRYVQIGWLIILGVSCLHAAEVANLRNGFSIRHEHHETQGETTRLYLDNDASGGYIDVPTAQIEGFQPAPADVSQATAPAKTNLESIIRSASASSQIDADFIASVIRAESANNPRAVSPKGAQGLMQLMPGTASQLGVPNAFDPQANVEGGTKYLRELLEKYNFDLVKALAAYNAGPQRVEQFGGVPPYYETRAYVARIVKDFNKKKVAQGKTALAKKSAPPKTASATKPASAKNGPKSATNVPPQHSE